MSARQKQTKFQSRRVVQVRICGRLFEHNSMRQTRGGVLNLSIPNGDPRFAKTPMGRSGDGTGRGNATRYNAYI